MAEKVAVIGLGYVGLPTAALIADSGMEVVGVDVSEPLVATLAEGKCPLGETEIVTVVERSLASGRLKAQTQAAEADIFIICVPTPITDEKCADLSMVKAATASTMKYVRPGNMVILESTSPIGTTEAVLAAAARSNGLDPEQDIDICYCPERVFPGNTVNEILKNDRVVGGLTPKAAKRAKTFYESFCEGKAYEVSASEAEFSKLMENTYRDVNIALANAFARIAESAGIDVSNVIKVANRHPRVNVHTPGPGVGGHCIPVDPWFLIESFPGETQLLQNSRLINDTQAERLVDTAKTHGLKSGEKVAILGAAYRGNIDDARDTPTEKLIEALSAAGCEWTTHDPHVTTLHMHSDLPANLTSLMDIALKDATAVFIMTDHDVYKGLRPEHFGAHRPELLIDGRGLADAEAFWSSGITVIRVGAPAFVANQAQAVKATA